MLTLAKAGACMSHSKMVVSGMGINSCAIFSWKTVMGVCLWRSVSTAARTTGVVGKAVVGATSDPIATKKVEEGERRFEVIHKKNSFRLVSSLKYGNQVTAAPGDFAGMDEICVAGRTNAGKSSMINHLCESLFERSVPEKRFLLAFSCKEKF